MAYITEEEMEEFRRKESERLGRECLLSDVQEEISIENILRASKSSKDPHIPWVLTSEKLPEMYIDIDEYNEEGTHFNYKASDPVLMFILDEPKPVLYHIRIGTLVLDRKKQFTHWEDSFEGFIIDLEDVAAWAPITYPKLQDSWEFTTAKPRDTNLEENIDELLQFLHFMGWND